MDNGQEHKNGFLNFVSNYDLILYSLLAAAFITYGVYLLLIQLWSSGIGYFVVGVCIISSMCLQIGHDLYHKRLCAVSKIVLGIWVFVFLILLPFWCVWKKSIKTGYQILAAHLDA